MNPALQRQLDLLRANLDARSSKVAPPPSSGMALGNDNAPRLSSAAAVDIDAVVHRENLPSSIREAVESFSARQVARVTALLKPLALRIYRLLHLLSCKFAEQKAYHANCAQLTFFCPAELICAHLRITRGSFYRSLNEVKALGLVDVRGHKTTVNGWQVRCDGTLWCVKLLPTTGKAARLRFDDLKATYRDLEADIRAGTTVWAVMRQSYQDKKMRVTVEALLHWALAPRERQNPVTMTVASEQHPFVEQLLSVHLAPKHERVAVVDRAAKAVAMHLGDSHLNFYRFMIWQLLRLCQQGQNHFTAVHNMVLRVGVDRQEGFARCAGALFVSRLKGSGLWDELRSVPAYRVGTA